MFNLPHTVKRSLLLDVPAHQVWEALTDSSLLSEWLAPEVELDPVEGGEVRCRYDDGEERRGEVELVELAERLAFRWRREGESPSRVEFVLDAVAEGTRLTVLETMPLPSLSPTMAAGWELRLRRVPLAIGRLALA